ncbi:LamG-like jellyroll fold domain-containing protein, partial [Haloferula sp. BvORR071]|uniref:LamG-like jellyroll fold domain-containing protein n=1 Tax=Haloferula sp. BvORR071 TaxID=1396141 RepID=UPI00055145C2
SFSVEVWLKPTAIPAAGALICPIASWRENTDTFGREGWLIYQGDAATGFNFRTYNKNAATIAASITSGAGVTAGAWHHVVATWDNSASVAKIYVNGVLKTTSAVIAPGGTNNRAFDPNTSMPLTLGSRSDNAFAWQGGIDEPAYYTSVLSDAQVLAHYNNGINPAPPTSYDTVVAANSPVGYWRLNEAVFVPRTPPPADNLGTLGSAADGGYVAGAKNSTTGPATGSGFSGFGASNSALSLQNANGYVSSFQPLLNNRTAFTVMGWVKRGVTHSARGGYFGQNDLLEFGDANNGTQIEAWSSASGQILTDAPYPFGDDQWGHIAYVADGTKVQLYLNGVLSKTVTSTVGSYGTSTYNFNIGGGGVFAATGDYFRGDIDEVAIFDHAVTSGRIKQFYDTALGNVGPGFVDTFPAVSPAGEIPEGQPYTLSIDPTGTPPFTYKWKLGNTEIPGATSRTYTVNSAAANNPISAPYTYSVEVTNGSGTSTSDATDVFVTAVLKWTGNAPSNAGQWDLGVSQNWKTLTGNVASVYSDDYAVQFDDTAPASGNVTMAADVFPKALIFNNSTAKNYSFTGPFSISGPTGATLSKSGTGTVELANDVVSMDSVVVNAGTVRVGNGTTGSLTPVTTVKVQGGTLEVKQASGTTYDSPTVVSAGGTLTTTGTGDLNFVGPISGAGNEVFDRNGVVVNGANSVGGTVTINSGLTAFDGSQQANRLAVNKLITVNSGATMEIRGVNALPTAANSVDVALNGSTLNVVSGGSTATGAGGQSHHHLRNLNLNGATINLPYSGGGSAYDGESFQLNGDITVSGSTASTITFGSGATTGNAGMSISAPTTSTTHTITVPDTLLGPAADLIINAEIENCDAAAANSQAAILAKAGTGTLRLANAITHTFSGTLRIDGGTLEATGSIPGPLVIAGASSITPGPGVATFTAGNTTMNGTYRCDIDGATCDKIVANGGLSFQPGSQIVFTVLAGGATASAYEIAHCTGTIDGALPNVVGKPAGYNLTLVSGNSLVLLKANAGLGVVITPTPPPAGGNETFATHGGGFANSASVSPEADWVYSNGAWRSNGQASAGGNDNTTYLMSPIYTLTQSGPITLSFNHRYSFEPDFYDGGAVDVSINGAAFTRVPLASFSLNGYNGSVRGDSGTTLQGQPAFVENSTGHPSYITSTCTLGTGVSGNTVQVRFISSSDPNTSGNLTPQGWEIDSFQLSNAEAKLLTLTWPAGTLQYSNTLMPPWTNLNVTSPYVIDTKQGYKRFFRVGP